MTELQIRPSDYRRYEDRAHELRAQATRALFVEAHAALSALLGRLSAIGHPALRRA